MLLTLKSFRFYPLKGSFLHRARVFCGYLLSSMVNDYDIFNSHRIYRNGLFISDQGATVKRFSLPISFLVYPFCLTFHQFNFYYLMKHGNAGASRHPVCHIPRLVQSPHCLTCQSVSVKSLLCLQRSPSVHPGMKFLVPLWEEKKATSFFLQCLLETPCL